MGAFARLGAMGILLMAASCQRGWSHPARPKGGSPTTTETSSTTPTTWPSHPEPEPASAQEVAEAETEPSEVAPSLPDKVEPSSEKVERPPGKNWSCSQCEETDRSGPFWTKPNEEADAVIWSLTVRADSDEHAIILGADPTPVELPPTSSWTCLVGAHWYRVIYFRSEFGIPLWFRELYCVDSEGGKTTLLSGFDCNGRGVARNSDLLSLWTGEKVVHVELSCAMRWALKKSESSTTSPPPHEAQE